MERAAKDEHETNYEREKKGSFIWWASRRLQLIVITMGILLAAGIAFALVFKAEHPSDETICRLFVEKADTIDSVCVSLGIKSRLYVSVVYGELAANYDFLDSFDEVRARLGLDPSVGFAQIKVSTAMWLEARLGNVRELSVSGSRRELVARLLNENYNILYSAFYVKLIRERLQTDGTEEPSVELIGSYYARGIDGRPQRLSTKYSNPVGRFAGRFFSSGQLLKIFPRNAP